MGALPRPDVPPGAQRDLVDALHDLHHRSGWPSLRALARQAGCSHTTVSAVFSSPRLPSWGTLELLVEAMDGDTAAFHDLWLAASSPDGHRPGPSTRIAGRRDELAKVRAHLETGTGLLLVTGEAGIGKTALVRCATDNTAADTFVATGACLPLSTEVPLLPIADALRSIHESDDGQWFKDALTDCPSYVAGSLTRVLPDLSDDAVAGLPVAGSLQHLFTAIAALLTRLSELRPLALLVEDLHWADDATLDLVEQLALRARAPRLVGTWRLDDTGTPPHKEDWFARTRRSPGTRSIELLPLTVEETADQLRLVSGAVPDAGRVAVIHSRSAGLPLFTEHLATQDDGDLPRLLVDLLDRRLGVLTGDAWATARALGLADRGLGDDVLRRSTDLTHDGLTTALHELHARRLITPAGAEVRLSHPLLADAVRRRVMPGEAAEVHRRLATALATSPDSSAAEIAVHWQAAGDAVEELSWRVAAAREAAQRLGPAQEAAQWLRALDLWSPGDEVHGTPPIDRTQAAFAAMDALWFAGEAQQVDAMATSLLRQIEELPPAEAAELLAFAGRTEASFRSLEEGLRLVERSVAIFESAGPSVELVLALRQQAMILVSLGRQSDAAEVLERARQVNLTVGDVDQERLLLAARAWHLFERGHRSEARETMRAAMRLQPPVPDPFVDVRLAKEYADLLLESGATSTEVAAAARHGLALAAENAVSTENVGWLRFDHGVALARSGDVTGAAELIDPMTGDEARLEHQPMQLVRAQLDLLRGRFAAARARTEKGLRRHASSVDVRSRWIALQADLEYWEGRPVLSLDLLVRLLDELVGLDEVVYAAPYYVLAARAAADVARSGRSDPVQRSHLGERLVDLRRRAVHDPLAHDPGHRATWEAELARLECADTVAHWARAASAWDRLARPHDAAYCRWRAAQVAIATGHAAAATKLLRRAARDAREHVPLLKAVRSTPVPTRAG